VGSMAGEATGADLLAVRAGGLFGVAVAAGLARGGAGVRLVAARAGLVSSRRCLAFLRMAAAAGRRLRARMWFVALVAAGGALVHELVLLLVAGLAAHLPRLRQVWQAGGSRCMWHAPCWWRPADVRGVAGCAGGYVRGFEREVMAGGNPYTPPARAGHVRPRCSWHRHKPGPPRARAGPGCGSWQPMQPLPRPGHRNGRWLAARAAVVPLPSSCGGSSRSCCARPVAVRPAPAHPGGERHARASCFSKSCGRWHSCIACPPANSGPGIMGSRGVTLDAGLRAASAGACWSSWHVWHVSMSPSLPACAVWIPAQQFTHGAERESSLDASMAGQAVLAGGER
jgi:hypothetical protein